MVTTGVGFTVTTVPEAAEAVQPLMSVMVTLYVPDTETVMEEVVAPVLQIYVAAAGTEEAVRVTEPPLQNVVGPEGVIVTTGVGFTVTTVPEAAEAVQPLMSVIVTL